MVGRTNLFVKELIAEVKKRPSLWDRKHKFYQKRDITRKMWLELSKRFQMSIPDVKSKWKTLRDNHRVEFKKSASGWAHMNDLHFLDEQISPKYEIVGSCVSPQLLPKEERYETEINIETGSVTSYGFNETVGINPQEVLQIEEKKCIIDRDLEDVSDSDRLFLMSLLPDMKKLHEEKNRAIRIQFQQILYNALYT